ncbi:MAG: hypothetical protein GY786_17065 [Proteobacteria bacterium]|nr:hypothetical protein [Pseudomonadota bacterium]
MNRFVLISQIQPSGGTPLSQLADGHPELDAHPDELKIGYPNKYTWPKLNIIDDPKNWYPSAARHRPLVYGDIREALVLWQKSAGAMLWNKKRYSDRVSILTLEDPDIIDSMTKELYRKVFSLAVRF